VDIASLKLLGEGVQVGGLLVKRCAIHVWLVSCCDNSAGGLVGAPCQFRRLAVGFSRRLDPSVLNRVLHTQ